MNIQMKLGGIRFEFDADDGFEVEESLSPFFCTNQVNDVNVTIRRTAAPIPRPGTAMAGEDLLLEYYEQDGRIQCLAKGSAGRYLSCTCCSADLTRMECVVSLAPGASMHRLGTLLRMLPIRMVLQRKGVSFFHAAQVAVGETGIVFTAPSGTGKTTQSRLWQKYRDAQIICNDRTLIRGGMTYGYPVDGSEPVISGAIHRLGAVVLLAQAPVNRVRRLKPREILVGLMPQLVIDTWDPAARALAMQQLLELCAQYPVYQLSCTPDEAAVICLERQLKMDGVL